MKRTVRIINESIAKSSSSPRPINWFGCAAHSLQLAIKLALRQCPELDSIIDRCHKLADEFHNKQYLTQALYHVQNQDLRAKLSDLQPVTVILPVETRWNSKFSMMERL
ncbi:hypothetical protein BGX26_008134, partial [Mortierella sp. AD094]